MTFAKVMVRLEAKVKHRLVSNNSSKGRLLLRRLLQELVAAEPNLPGSVDEIKKKYCLTVSSNIS